MAGLFDKRDFEQLLTNCNPNESPRRQLLYNGLLELGRLLDNCNPEECPENQLRYGEILELAKGLCRLESQIEQIENDVHSIKRWQQDACP